MTKNETNAEVADLSTIQQAAVNSHKTIQTSNRTIEESPFPPGRVDPRTSDTGTKES